MDDVGHRYEMTSVCLLQPANHLDVFFGRVQAESIVVADQQAFGAKALERFCRFGFACIDACCNLRHAPALFLIRPNQEQRFNLGYCSDILQYEVPYVARDALLCHADN